MLLIKIDDLENKTYYPVCYKLIKDYSFNQVYRDYNSRQHAIVLHIDVILQDFEQINVNHKTTSCIVLVLPEIIT